jgi:hypothetical protein
VIWTTNTSHLLLRGSVVDRDRLFLALWDHLRGVSTKQAQLSTAWWIDSWLPMKISARRVVMKARMTSREKTTTALHPTSLPCLIANKQANRSHKITITKPHLPILDDIVYRSKPLVAGCKLLTLSTEGSELKFFQKQLQTSLPPYINPQPICYNSSGMQRRICSWICI